MNRKNYRTATLLILISLAFMAGVVGCTEGPVGIFASIAQETDINASRTKAFDGTSPEFVGVLGTNYYTLINGTLWSRPVAGGSWNKITPPADIPQGEASSAAIAGSHLYVVFGRIGDSDQKVWAKEAATDWDETLAILPPSVKIDSLLTANNELFALTRTYSGDPLVTEYSLQYLSGASFASAGVAVTNISSRPTSVAHDGTNFWVTAGEAIYQGDTADTLVSVTANLPDDTFAGMTTDGATVIFASKSGKLYTYSDSGAWPVSSVFEKSDLPHAFTTPVIVDDGVKKYLLVGTYSGAGAASASGYLEFDIPIAGFNPTTASASEGSDFADIVNFQTSVSANYITSLVVDEGAGNPRVFALTVGNGLWSNYYNNTTNTWSGWVRE